MTEEEWATSSDIDAMLSVAQHRLSDRLFRLLACGILRRVWEHLGTEAKRAVETAEHFADGLSNLEEVRAAGQGVRQRPRNVFEPEPLPTLLTSLLAEEATSPYTHDFLKPISGLTQSKSEAASLARLHRGSACNLLRDLVVTPSKFEPILNPAWLAWHNGTIRFLAEEIYQQRAFDQMPILGDALEDAGCGDWRILDHCRGTSDHIRGCWVLDLLLRKEPRSAEDMVSLVLRSGWPRRYRTLEDTVEATSPRRIRGGRPSYAPMTLQLEPRTAGPAILFQHAQSLRQVLPQEFVSGIVAGVRDVLDLPTNELDLAGLTIRLVDGRYHDVDSTREGFMREAASVFGEALR